MNIFMLMMSATRSHFRVFWYTKKKTNKICVRQEIYHMSLEDQNVYYTFHNSKANVDNVIGLNYGMFCMKMGLKAGC